MNHSCELGAEAQPYLAQITERIPQVVRLFGLDGSSSPRADISLEAYAASLCGAPLHSFAPLQDGDDLLGVAAAETRRLLGEEHARALIRTLEEDFCALTANHHGVDFHPEFAQGMLLFALERWNRPAVPVFSVGGVPMNNVSFPRGLCLGSGGSERAKPRQIPIFPLRCKHTMVCVQPSFSKDMLDRAALSSAVRELCENERRVVNQLLELYASPEVLGQRLFCDQATILNSRLWSSCFTPETNAPHLVSLDMQTLSGQLAQRDAADTSSLFHALVIEPQGALALCRALDGKRGCWTLGQDKDGLLSVERGSFLFWALDAEGRAVSMSLDAAHHTLRATQRPDLDMPLTREGIEQALAQKRVIPGLFLFFVLVAMARGLRCCGGVYQISYLPDMAAGVRQVLRSCNEAVLAERVEATSPMSTGLLPLRMRAPDCGDYAAGPVEFLMCGGLGRDVLGQLRELSARNAFTVSLAYHYEDLVPEPERVAGWNTALAVDGGIVLPSFGGNFHAVPHHKS